MCTITEDRSTKRRLVSAKNLHTADKDSLSDADLMSLLSDRNAALWTVPGQKKRVRCTIHEINGNDVASMCCINNFYSIAISTDEQCAAKKVTY